MAKNLFGDLSSDSSAERSRCRGKKSKINCGWGEVNTGSSVKDRDRGAMTGKFYPAKNAGGLKGKAAEGRDKQKKERCNSHKRDGRERKGGKCRSDGKEDENRTEKAGKKTFGARKTGKRMKNP